MCRPRTRGPVTELSPGACLQNDLYRCDQLHRWVWPQSSLHMAVSNLCHPMSLTKTPSSCHPRLQTLPRLCIFEILRCKAVTWYEQEISSTRGSLCGKVVYSAAVKRIINYYTQTWPLSAYNDHYVCLFLFPVYKPFTRLIVCFVSTNSLTQPTYICLLSLSCS